MQRANVTGKETLTVFLICFAQTGKKKKKLNSLWTCSQSIYFLTTLPPNRTFFSCLLIFFPIPFIFISWWLITLHLNFHMVQYYVAVIIFPLKSTLNKMAYLKHALITPGFRSHV